MSEKIGSGDADPTRALRLLWRRSLGDPQGARGPRAKFSVDEITNAAVALADEEGLEALTMRRLADRLGIAAMTLYTYVPGRAELVGLLVDQVAGEVPLAPMRGSTRDQLRLIARNLWEEYLRHPWLIETQSARPWFGPHISDRYEWQLSALEGLGLDDIAMDQIVTLLTSYVAGAAGGKIIADRTKASSTQTDEEWWAAHAPVLEQLMDGSRYPISGRVGQAAGEAYGTGDPDLSFDFGLERVLDGIEAYIAAHGGGGLRRPRSRALAPPARTTPD